MADVISDEQTHIFEIVNYVSLCGIIGTFGIVANIANAIVFYKQGFHNTVNIAFFGLAISDLACLTSQLWTSIGVSPAFKSSGVRWHHVEVVYLLAAWPHVCFSRITSFITVYITAERYLSIAFPLRVKNIVTPKTTMTVILLIYFINIVALIPEYGTSYLGWRFVLAKNQTLLGIVFTRTRVHVHGLCYFLQSLLGMSSFAGVIIFTTLLVFKLKQSSQWRSSAISNNGRNEIMANKDQKTVKMVVIIASILIVCYTPGAVIGLAAFIVGAELNVRGTYENTSESMWSIAFAFQSINSSVNIFFYYSMSSKYKQTFKENIINCRARYREC